MYYRSFHAAMLERFGCKVYKLSLDSGMGCPNRDGTIGTRGCIFCSQLGSGDFAAPSCDNMEAQLALAKQRVAHKNPNGKYIAYFQSFTNTYAPAEQLEHLFSAAAAPSEIVALDIATRPDCLGPEVLSVLQGIAEKKPLFVELGLQTIDPVIADYIRRGYPLSVFDRAVEDLHAIGAEVVVHQILGLPGENPDMMVQTARYIGGSGAEGIKFHLLHILDDTDLYQEYLMGKVPVMEMEDYFSVLAQCLRVLPPEMVIHRLTGDGAKRHLVAPLWSADKKNVLNRLNRYLTTHNVIQGSEYQGRRI